jgi:hypothetical protein
MLQLNLRKFDAAIAELDAVLADSRSLLAVSTDWPDLLKETALLCRERIMVLSAMNDSQRVAEAVRDGVHYIDRAAEQIGGDIAVTVAWSDLHWALGNDLCRRRDFAAAEAEVRTLAAKEHPKSLYYAAMIADRCAAGQDSAAEREALAETALQHLQRAAALGFRPLSADWTAGFPTLGDRPGARSVFDR